MKKNFIIFLFVLIFIAAAAEIVSAQTFSKEDIAETFTIAVLREQFFAPRAFPDYFRFAKSIWYFDNLGLSYFPTEQINCLKWEYLENPRYAWYFNCLQPMEEKDWALLGRENTGKVFKQTIYLDEPYNRNVFHGLNFPDVTHLDDFYLYTDLFVTDSYPEDTGSCYVYFSNSTLVGNRTSYGILIDPRDGIYKATNNYDTFSTVQNKAAYSGLFLLGSEVHRLELIEKLEPSLYEGKTGSIGNDIFINDDMDGRFSADLESLRESAKKEGQSEDIKAYRIELVRIHGITAVYINGVFATEFEDQIMTDGLNFYSARLDDELTVTINDQEIDLKDVTDSLIIDEYVIRRFDEETWTIFDPEKVTGKVSWTIGPRLYTGGRTVTVAAGNINIYTRAQGR